MQRGLNSQNSLLLENYNNTDDWQCHIFEVDAVIYVMLSNAEKCVLYGE